MIHLLLKDTKNMIYHNMTFLSQEMENLLDSNVVEMRNAKMSIAINASDLDISHLNLEQQGWKRDDGLYEKLLFEYTELTGKVLTRWTR